VGAACGSHPAIACAMEACNDCFQPASPIRCTRGAPPQGRKMTNGSGFLHFRVTDAERAVITRAARLAGVTLSVYLRRTALTASVGLFSADQRRELGEVVDLLKEKSADVNGIAKIVNMRTFHLPNRDIERAAASEVLQVKALAGQLGEIVGAGLAIHGVLSIEERQTLEVANRQIRGVTINANQMRYAFKEALKKRKGGEDERTFALEIMTEIEAAVEDLSVVLDCIAKLCEA
jgi:uncharacterized protein (DUF1778 family)